MLCKDMAKRAGQVGLSRVKRVASQNGHFKRVKKKRFRSIGLRVGSG